MTKFRKTLIGLVCACTCANLGALAMPGDLNGDGSFDITDLGILVNILCGTDQAPVSGEADIDNDGEVTIADVGMLINYITGTDTPEPEGTTVDITLSDEGTSIANHLARKGVTAEVVDGTAVVTSPLTDEIEVNVTGSTTQGGVKVYTQGKLTLTLNDVTIVNPNGSAINMQVSEKSTLAFNGTNNLTDASKYQTPTGEKEKGAVYCLKGLNIKGKGTLNVTGNYKHAIVAEKALNFKSGTVNVLASASDGLHGSGIEFNGGTYTCANTAGDGADADTGTLAINDGTINLSMSAEDTKGLKADGDIAMNGGDITVNISGNAVKAFKTKANMSVTSGSITVVSSGEAVLVESDPSYVAAIKTDGDLNISGGNINVTMSGSGSKGLSVDGNASLTGGDYTISCAGAAVKYVDINNNNDTYSSTCITVDGNATITGGTFNLSNSGSAGKCIKVDGELVLGDADGSGPEITATATGERVKEDSSSSSTGNNQTTGPGGRPGGWGPGGGGFDKNADYANPKVIKAVGNLTVNSGKYILKSTNEGGEGLESKTIVTINGGDIDINTVDDGINAATNITINGGTVRSIATANDGIDSNGTITINGGTVIAIGAKSPECGLDCDNNTFTITGGTIFALGGDNSSPTSSKCTQCVVSYSKSVSAGSSITIADSNDNNILTYTKPTTLSSGSKMLMSSPEIRSGQSYTIYTGGSVNGGESTYELTTGGTYSPGIKATTFTGTTTLVSK